MSAWDLLAIWFGAGISIAEFWAGAILVPGVSLFTALIMIIIGHVIGNALMGLIAIEGYRVGVPTMVLTRRPLGVKGSYLASVLNYLQLIGWTAVMNIVGARAIDTVLVLLGYPSNLKLWIIIFGLLNTIWALVGPEKWKWLEKISAILLLILITWLTIVTINTIGEFDWGRGTGELPPLLALDLVVAMPVSWLPLVADYSRLSKSGAFWGIFIGYFISSSLFYFIGGYSNAYLGLSDPISIIATYGLGIPAMIIIILSTTTTTFLDIYSAAITYKNIKPKEPLNRQILIVGIAGTMLALIFPMEEYEWFLLLIGGAFIPLAAIMITDYYLIAKGNYNLEELIGGKITSIRTSGVIAWALGFTMYMTISIYASWLGSTIPSMIATSILYYTLIKLIKH
jgi:NCS1 family nucleobase:cation symporter-1